MLFGDVGSWSWRLSPCSAVPLCDHSLHEAESQLKRGKTTHIQVVSSEYFILSFKDFINHFL